MLRFAALVPLLLTASPGAWERVADRCGVVVEQRTESVGRVRELRAEGVVGASPAACLAAVRNPDFFRRSMPFAESSVVVAREGPDVVFFHTRVAPPFVAARESTLRVVVEQMDGAPGGWRQRWTLAHERGPAPQEGAVLVVLNDGAWEFTPLDGGRRTLARFRLRTDPGGELPCWIVEKGNISAVLDAFHELRRASGEPEQTAENASSGG
jgi:hypothetical protein